ncbi:GNAT family N-acetyltransferase [Streptomyces sp. NBC_01264]|uniref:GNAT family N-acetyltransferase n=1 Tax=Streptomyces sp. NBC_01264 TaxID=2903804 RepID=UPI00224E5AF7|nr:GNAT family N-acetyltransferase [Streptomyces sp. NBC_01264]MCX4781820.1 GNAT family N-acetyltransferase [Streptomyces sp. NBC_01264]
MHVRTRRSAPAIQGIDISARPEETLRIQAQALGLPSDALDAQLAVRRARGACGLTALGAFEGGRMVGFAYGVGADEDYPWRAPVLARLHHAGHSSWAQDTFYVCELHMLPSFQRRGLGTLLLTSLCSRASERRVVLTTPDGPTAARRLYQRFGYRDLVVPPAGSGEYTVMGARLPLVPEVFRSMAA